MRKQKPVSDSFVIMTELVLPNDTNTLNNLMGGRMMHLDFYHFPDSFTRFMHYGHGRRNNEPYMQPLAELDLPGVLKSRGFTGIEVVPFQEAESVGPDSQDVWRLPWTVISAKKPRRPSRRG